MLRVLRRLGSSNGPPRQLPSSTHLPCYATLRVRVGANLRCLVCQAAAFVEEADRRALQQHSEVVAAVAMVVARHAG